MMILYNTFRRVALAALPSSTSSPWRTRRPPRTECATKRSTAAASESTSPSPSGPTLPPPESTWAGLPSKFNLSLLSLWQFDSKHVSITAVTEAPRAVAATVETDMEETGMVATVTVAAIATEAATAAPGATAAVATGADLPVRTTVAAAAVATGGLAPDHTLHVSQNELNST